MDIDRIFTEVPVGLMDKAAAQPAINASVDLRRAKQLEITRDTYL